MFSSVDALVCMLKIECALGIDLHAFIFPSEAGNRLDVISIVTQSSSYSIEESDAVIVNRLYNKSQTRDPSRKGVRLSRSGF